jgi:hypothetical protein
MRGPSRKTREIVLERDDHCCVVCVRSIIGRPYSLQHRRARGMGGSRDPLTDSPANLITTCGSGVTGCHGRIEANPDEAREHGWRVDQGRDPRQVPVRHHHRWVLLDEFGGLDQKLTP